MKRINVTYDYEFLLEPAMPEATFVYIYRSGFMKTSIKRALTRLAETRGWKPSGGDIDSNRPFEAATDFELLFLGQTYIICDWARARKRHNDLNLKSRLKSLAEGGAKQSAHFIPASVPLIETDLWSAIGKSCFVVEEPVVAQENLVEILRYLDRVNLYIENANLAENAGFVFRFREMLEQSKPSIGDVANNYTLQILSCLDPTNGQFDFERHHKLWAREVARVTLYGRLKQYLQAPDTGSLDRLLISFAAHAAYENQTAERLYVRLCKMTANLIRSEISSAEPRGKKCRSQSEPTENFDLALWATLVLAWDAHFIASKSNGVRVARGPSTVVAQLLALCRAFEARVMVARWDRATLDDLWVRVPLDSELIQCTRAVSEAKRHLAEQLAKLDMPMPTNARISELKKSQGLDYD